MDYSFENIAHDSEVLAHYSRELSIELYLNNYVNKAAGNTSVLIPVTENESKLLLALLNYGQINESVLQNILGSYSAEELKQYKYFLYNIAQMKKDYGANLDFTKYTLNKKVGKYINSLSEAADNGKIPGIIKDFVKNKSIPSEVADNPAVYIALASYDRSYGTNEMFTLNDANEYIVYEKIEELIEIVRGKKASQ